MPNMSQLLFKWPVLFKLTRVGPDPSILPVELIADGLTANERVKAETVDEDVVHVFRAGEQFGNHVQVRANLACLIQHVLHMISTQPDCQ